MGYKGYKRNKSVMKHDFSHAPTVNIQRSRFNRSHGLKTTFDAGYLIPIYVDEALPGDSFNVNLSSVARLATPITPFIDNIMLDFFFFAVPNRLIWDNFQKFMGEQDNPADSVDFLVPKLTTTGAGFATLELGDYFGLPILVHPLTVNSLHFRAYNLIFNTWFRDENLQDSVTVDKDDGPDDIADYVLLKRGKRHDYFTSCLPWPQKGAGVELPLGDSAPVTLVPYTEDNANMEVRTASNDAYLGSTQTLWGIAAGDLVEAGASSPLVIDPNGRLETDLSNATAATINSLREAFQLQKLLERDARGGTRYTEILYSHFKVNSPDARLQRPEYLGGGSASVSLTPVANTVSNVGVLGAAGYASQRGAGFTKSFVEHSVIIGLVCARADLTYQKGIDRMWNRQTKYDFYWPALANLGEQEVLSKELFVDGTADDEGVFGYQERWAEYRYKNSQITGQLRSDNASSLDLWHLAQDFATTRPALNTDFIVENPPIDRVIATPTEPHFIMDCYFKTTTTRPMPMYSVPGMIDHF